MKDFQHYLMSKKIVPDKQLPYYINWVSQCFNYFNRSKDERISKDEFDQFLTVLGKQKEDWQVQQAREAINLYVHFCSRDSKIQNIAGSDTADQ